MNVDTREVQTTARTLGWDALVFATGSTPFVPPIPGCNATHVFTFRTTEDIRAIRAIAGPAVVLGGGVLGVETAAALARSGDNVTLVHRGPWLMERHLDEKAGVLLEEALAARGVRCELASGIAAIDGNSVTLLNGRSVAAARVVLATGVQPNVVLAQASGIRCARGIVVDHQMQTSVPDVYAIGECCEIDGQTFGWSPLSGAGGYPRRTAGRRRHRAVCSDRQRCAPQGDRRGAVQPRSRGRAGGRCGLERMGSADPLLSSFTDPSGALAGVLLMGTAAARRHLPIYWQRLRPRADWLFDRFTTQPQVAGQNAMTKPTLVVVGHGMVGHHFLEDCVNRNLHQQYQIVVFGEERYAAYDRVHLSEYFGGRSAASLSLVEGFLCRQRH